MRESRSCTSAPSPCLIGTSAPLDRLAAHSSGPEYTDGRELLTYPSVDDARTVIGNVVHAAESCPTQDLSTTSTWVHELTERSLGEESYSVSRTYLENGRPTIGGMWWHVVRVGNAVFLDSGTGEAFPVHDFERFLEEDAARLAPLVESLACQFSETSCTSETDSPISEGFPLAAGWPRDDSAEPGPDWGRQGPNRSMPDFSYAACGRELDAPHSIDFLRARWSNVEDYRSRQLFTFPDTDTARAELARVVDFYESCPQQEGDGTTVYTEFRTVNRGDYSTAIVRITGGPDGPAIGLEVLLVVRVERALLIDTSANEASGFEDAIRAQIAGQSGDLATVVAAMCEFTDDGC